jgi:hypothetical protein
MTGMGPREYLSEPLSESLQLSECGMSSGINVAVLSVSVR